MGNKRYLRIIVLSILFLALGSAFYMAYQKDDSPVQVGDLAPDFTLTNLEGEKVSLSDYRGKGVLLNFWASYCDPCKREMPAMEKQYQAMKDEGIEILAVNIAESHVAINSFKNRFGFTFPILLDRDRSITNRYGIIPIPTSFFIDSNGIVVAKVTGEMDEGLIKHYLHQIKP